MKGGGGDCVTRRDFQTSADGAVASSEALGLMANAKGATLAHLAVAATAAARWGAVAVAAAAVAAVVRRALTPKKMRAAASTKAITPKMAAQMVGAMSNS